jgi:hypothetical protein
MRLMETSKPSIIHLEDIIMEGEKLIHELSKFMIGRKFNYINSIGRYGGNINGWYRSSYTLSKS